MGGSGHHCISSVDRRIALAARHAGGREGKERTVGVEGTGAGGLGDGHIRPRLPSLVGCPGSRTPASLSSRSTRRVSQIIYQRRMCGTPVCLSIWFVRSVSVWTFYYTTTTTTTLCTYEARDDGSGVRCSFFDFVIALFEPSWTSQKLWTNQ